MKLPADGGARLSGAVLLAALPLVFVSRGLPPAERASVATFLPLLAAIYCAWSAVGRAAGARPRRFWVLTTAGLGAGLLFDLSALVQRAAPEAAAALRLLWLAAFFVAILLALDARPHLGEPFADADSGAFERAGAVVFVFGLLVYGTGYGGSTDPRFFGLGLQSLALGLTLYLLARLVLLGRASPDPRWRSTYYLLAAGAVALVLSGSMQLASGSSASGASLVLRLCAPLAVVLAARRNERPEPSAGASPDVLETGAPPGPEPLARFWSGPLSLYAVTFPVVHLAGYSLGLLDQGLRQAREGWGLFFAVVLAGLAVLQKRGLERELRDAARRLRRHSHYDPLTGLPNRTWFLERVGRSIDRVGRTPDYQFAVLLLDLDRYRLIEHGLGRRLGERMLVELAGRLKACLRPGDMVARLGEDQFGILADHFRRVLTARDAERVASRIEEQALGRPFQVDSRQPPGLGTTVQEEADRILLEAVRPPIEFGANQVYLRASIGIALSVTGYARAEDLLTDAQAAVRRAKRRGGGTHEIFDPEMQAESVARVTLETDLHHAFERSELFVQYQPVVGLLDKRVAGFEALLRWRHPSRGLLAAREFVVAAEDTGLILPISRRLIGEACARTRRWQETFGRRLFLSFNFAGPQFAAGDLVEGVLEALEGSGLDGRCLRVEITEGVAISNFDAVLKTLERLRQAGVGLLIDDFGTGYSSLSYLHRLPAQGIKIDRSFVERLPADVAAKTLVRSIVELGHGLGREVIAEGVETPEQLECVRALGCEFGQGYYFAHPLDGDDVEDLLRAPPRW